jgi:hypothetical protein
MQYLPISAVPHPQKDPKSHPPSLYLKSRAPTAVPPPPFPPALTSALTSPPPHSLCLKYQHPITLVFPSANMFKARVSVSPLCILSRNPASVAPHWTITTAHPPVSALGTSALHPTAGAEMQVLCIHPSTPSTQQMRLDEQKGCQRQTTVMATFSIQASLHLDLFSFNIP